MGKSIKLTTQFGSEKVLTFHKGSYLNNDNLFVGAYEVYEDGEKEPYCNITVNFEEPLPDGMAWVDSNNADRNLIKAMEEMGWIVFGGCYRQSGFCKYPLYQFTDDFLEEVTEL